MENISGGYCTKTATKVLMGLAGATIGVATGGLGYIFGAWAFYSMLDSMDTCEEW